MKMSQLISNFVTSRASWFKSLTDPRRDIDKECGHPYELTLEDYKRLYERGDMSARIVSLYPEESWSEDPLIFETEDLQETDFEAGWSDLEKEFSLISLMERADILSGIGRFGIILFGFDDGLSLDRPLPALNDRGEPVGTPQSKLLYVRTFDESLVTVKELEKDPTNPRYGLPTKYEVIFASDDISGFNSTNVNTSVHWSRVIHLADNARSTSEILAPPRMKLVMNRLLDLQKIAGGSGEMFWKGGFPGLSLETLPAAAGEDIEFDAESTKEQIEAYMNGLQRYIALENMSAKNLTVQLADPNPPSEVQIRLIAIAMGCPWRILMGSEVGQLASGQDVTAWNKRMNRRREKYITPKIIRPVINRLINVGALPKPKELLIQWSDLNSPSDKDRATVAFLRTNALSKYVMGGVDNLVDPFHYLTIVVGFTNDEAESILKGVGDHQGNIDTSGIAAPGQIGSAPNPGQVNPGRINVPPARASITSGNGNASGSHP